MRLSCPTEAWASEFSKESLFNPPSPGGTEAWVPKFLKLSLDSNPLSPGGAFGITGKVLGEEDALPTSNKSGGSEGMFKKMWVIP